MVVALVGEAFLSSAVEVLLDRIISHDFVDLFCSKKLNILLLKRYRTTLISFEIMLNDAEEKQITNPTIKEWLDELSMLSLMLMICWMK